ncbi:MAG: helix-turn-helix domain-containing protein, partial [Oscillospiraceae bacterium]|nr:helix-turn-helix domain-containing protein [Oscillospiraceae bacterium]
GQIRHFARVDAVRVGDNSTARRLPKNLRQARDRDHCGIDYLSMIETDQREPSIHIYRCIADALDINLWQLFCDLSDETLFILDHFNDCTETEIRTLGRFIDGNKEALRQHHSQDFDLKTEVDSYGQ